MTESLMKAEGPPEKTPAAQELATKHGFSYRNLLGEIVYPYMICRVDIGFASCFLSHFLQAPHDEHFVALKGVCRYLRKTKSWGIIFWHPKPLTGLPPGTFSPIDEDPTLPPFPSFYNNLLYAFMDAAYGTDNCTRRSVTGLVVLLCCAAIAYKSQLQSTVSTLSTEAEFLAAVTTAKIVKYLRAVLKELDYLINGPSPLLVDNKAAIDMINEKKPTLRSRHIEI